MQFLVDSDREEAEICLTQKTRTVFSRLTPGLTVYLEYRPCVVVIIGTTSSEPRLKMHSQVADWLRGLDMEKAATDRGLGTGST